MEVNDFVGAEKLKSGTGIDIGAGSLISGGAYMPIMLRVEDYDIKDWSPVFTPALVKSFNMTIGYKATISADLTNTLAIGTQVVPITSNTVQLGSWSQQVLTIKEPAFRLDERDMTDIAASEIGLEFIDTLKPIKYRSKFRESSIDEKYPLPHPINEPEEPYRDTYRIKNPDGSFFIDEQSYNDAVVEYNKKNAAFKTYRDTLNAVLTSRKNEYANAGTVEDSQFSYGFKPTELFASTTAADADFKPLSNPTTDLTVYYKPSQLIVPVVKAIQQEHTLIIDLRTDVDILRQDVDALELKVAGVEQSLQTVQTTTLPNLTDRLNTLEEAAANPPDPGTGGTVDLSGVNQSIANTNLRIDDLTRRVTTLENNPGTGGTGTGTPADTSTARSISIDYGYNLNFRNPDDGTTKFGLQWGTTAYPNSLVVGGALNTNILGSLISIRGGVQTDLWASGSVIKWLGSDFSPVVLDGKRITLGSDRNEMIFRWSTIYSSTDLNVSSDMRLKSDKRPLEEREKAAALEIKESIGLYKLIRSVNDKGEDARLHVGVYAQDIISIFEKHGIDALSNYAFIGRDHSEDGEEGYLNIRYGELALFILAAL